MSEDLPQDIDFQKRLANLELRTKRVAEVTQQQTIQIQALSELVARQEEIVDRLFRRRQSP